LRPEQKQAYLKRYSELKKQGKAFYPYSIFKDVAASALVLLILLAFVVILGAPLESKADPTNTSYVPRPEWYFMFLFEALKYFPGEIEWIGVVVVPGITLLLLILFPWLDTHPRRRPSRRPVSMAAAAFVVAGTLYLIFLGFQSTPSHSTPPLTALQDSGRRIYQSQNCAACHAINGVGGKVGPDLFGIGDRMPLDQIHLYIEDPKAVNPNATMPGFLPPLTHEEVEQVTQYLLAFKK